MGGEGKTDPKDPDLEGMRWLTDLSNDITTLLGQAHQLLPGSEAAMLQPEAWGAVLDVAQKVHAALRRPSIPMYSPLGTVVRAGMRSLIYYANTLPPPQNEAERAHVSQTIELWLFLILQQFTDSGPLHGTPGRVGDHETAVIKHLTPFMDMLLPRLQERLARDRVGRYIDLAARCVEACGELPSTWIKGRREALT